MRGCEGPEEEVVLLLLADCGRNNREVEKDGGEKPGRNASNSTG